MGRERSKEKFSYSFNMALNIETRGGEATTGTIANAPPHRGKSEEEVGSFIHRKLKESECLLIFIRPR